MNNIIQHDSLIKIYFDKEKPGSRKTIKKHIIGKQVAVIYEEIVLTVAKVESFEIKDDQHIGSYAKFISF